MPEYNLTGLSSGTFEQLIQTLASKVIGPGSVIFGPGPDGGREATFEGRMDYPSVSEPWSGYLVLQAKFLQRPLGTQKDGAWVLRQLEDELKKFTDGRRKLRRPEYYIFCTNVPLSAVHMSGTRDRSDQLFRKYADRLPLKGHAIWDYEIIRSFLDDAEDVRRAYAAWITAGDVLRRAMDWLEGVQPDFHEVMASFLQFDLLDDRYARLDQAGHTTKDLAPMASLFVDLPVSRTPEPEPPDESKDERFPRGFLAELLAAGARKLDPVSVSERREPPDREPGYGRYVLIGGPGQGKTTIGQFACQLYRAAILDARANLAPEVREALAGIKNHCTAVKVDSPRGRRFPIRIVLNDFAKKLAEQSVTSLLQYLLLLIKERTAVELHPAAFQKWLRLFPWFLVLDGLDEVPPSSNRVQVIQAVTNFLVQANDCGADLLVLSTTRPQGYDDDFSPKYYRHRYLTPLSDRRALYYGERLANVSHGEATSMARDVVAGLRSAIDSPMTARLMRSPLQVTIMATLVARGGPAPQERWVLFRRYYNVIYDRETAKRLGDVTELLRSYRTHIDAIHHGVGLTLQIESERSGQTDARLATDDLCKIVSARLASEGLVGPVAVDLQKRMIDAATDRLVFLVGVREGQIGFEIRSLQEFMAAEALMDGADTDAIARLKRIAPIAHWNNVFLFAAGKCFADRQHLRPTIVDICATLNELSERDRLSHYVSAGSQLALLLLEDGLARQQWTYELALARNACRLRFRHPSEFHHKLASAYHEDLRTVYEEEIEIAPQNVGSLALVVALADRGVEWAASLAEGRLSADIETYFERWFISYRFGSWQRKKLLQLLPKLEPSAASRVRHLVSQLPPWFEGLFPERLSARLVNGRAPTVLALTLPKMSPPGSSPPSEISSAPRWLPVTSILRLRSEPSCQNLAAAIRACGSIDKSQIWTFLRDFAPWPLASIVFPAAGDVDSDEMATLAERGEFGDARAWTRAEERWMEAGVSSNDFDMFEKNGLRPGPYFNDGGFPFTIAYPEHERSSGDERTQLLQRLWRERQDRSGGAAVAGWLCQSPGGLQNLTPGEIARVLVDGNAGDSVLDVSVLSFIPAEHIAEISVLEAINSIGKSLVPYGPLFRAAFQLSHVLFDAWMISVF